jgi:hypothetical protein
MVRRMQSLLMGTAICLYMVLVILAVNILMLTNHGANSKKWTKIRGQRSRSEA